MQKVIKKGTPYVDLADIPFVEEWIAEYFEETKGLVKDNKIGEPVLAYDVEFILRRKKKGGRNSSTG